MSAAKKAPKRSGILAGGNWIIDQVKMIDVYPQREQLANITGATVTGTGGTLLVTGRGEQTARDSGLPYQVVDLSSSNLYLGYDG